MPWNNQITGQKWQSCERCGEDWPKRVLVRQTEEGHANGGWLVCPNCVDEPGHVLKVKAGNEDGD